MTGYFTGSMANAYDDPFYLVYPGPEWIPLMCGCGKQIGWIAKGGVQTAYCEDCVKKEMEYRNRWKNENPTR